VILTLTRIYSLTHGHPTVVREITTPTLPTFVTNCLNCISTGPQTKRHLRGGSPLLRVVLQAFITLLPRHPSTFRPFVNQLKPILAVLTAPTPSNLDFDSDPAKTTRHVPRVSVGLAQRLHALLPYCAPKNTSPEQWLATVHAICAHAHITSDHVFRAHSEDHGFTRSDSAKAAAIRGFDEVPGDSNENELALSAWDGVSAGTERLVGLIEMLQAHLATSSNLSLAVPVSAIWSVIQRMLSLYSDSVLKPDADREEREELWRSLPRIHEAAINLTEVVLKRLGVSSLAIAQSVLERLVWAFARDIKHESIRLASYRLTTLVIEHIGPSLTKDNISSLGKLITQACQDVSCHEASTTSQAAASGTPQAGTNSTGQNLRSTTGAKVSTILLEAAMTFLCRIITFTRPESWSSHLRTIVDRTAIMEQNKDMMVASVLQPAHSAGRTMASILPFLARSHPATSEAEAVIRPRLPVIRGSKRDHQAMEGQAPDEEEDVAMHANYQTYASDAPFVSTQQSLGGQSYVTAPEQPTSIPPAPSPLFRDMQSPKRLRSDEVPIRASDALVENMQPEPKRPKVDQDITMIETSGPSAPDEREAHAADTIVFSAPPPMEDKVVAVPVATEETKPRVQDPVGLSVGESADESDSDIPSLHMESEMEDDEDEDEDDE
jgi:pre-rRNA-processing protein RIX1